MQTPKSITKLNKKDQLVGLEFENQLVYLKNGRAIGRKDIKKLWRKMIEAGWSATYDKYTKALVGVTKKTKNGEIVLNTDTSASNIEFAFPPKRNLKEAEREYRKIFNEVVKLAKSLGFTALSLGALPISIKGDLADNKTEKGLYLVMGRRCLRHNIQLPISAHQIGVSVPIKKLTRVVNCLTMISGFVIALTANSVLEDGKIQEWKEVRSLHWKTPFGNNIVNITNILGGVSKKPFDNLSDYFKFIWNASPIFIVKNEKWATLDDWKITIFEYLKSGKFYKATTALNEKILAKADSSDLNLMTILNWNDAKIHIIFDDKKINLKEFLNSIKNGDLDKYLGPDKVMASYIEIRMCSASPKGEEMAMPALLLGIVSNLKEAEKFCSQFSWTECIKFKEEMSIRGMDYCIKSKHITEYLKDMVEISKSGLKKRGFGEEKYLKTFYNRVRSKKNPADKTMAIFKKEGIRGVIKRNSY